MDRENQLQLFKDFIINCTTNANSLKNYIDFKRINECLQQLFPERKDVSILDFDDPIAFEKVVNELEGLKTYIDFNAKGKNQYSTTVSWYQRFLNAKHLFSKQKMTFLRINESLGLPLQQIFYGAPGTGKSHEIKKLTKGESVIRTTFHPDSDYSTFVGCYKPTMDEVDTQVVPVVVKSGISLQEPGTYKEKRITYKFVMQAFLKAYLGAWKKWADAGDDRVAPQFLVVEEINRGNCAQIFGDLFQLLDRSDNNFSEYPIEADTDLQQEIERAFNEPGEYRIDNDINVDGVVENYTSNYNASLSEDIQHGRILLLPSNLYIWATMNTSDQSLFPIDSAFKRRWEWKYIKIAEGRDEETRELLNWTVKFDYKEDDKPFTFECNWWDFIKAINEKIAEATSSDDKKLGYFFCKPKDKNSTTIDEERFVGKVVFYLWNDVFKDEENPIFKVNEGKGEPSFDAFYKEDELGKTVVDTAALRKFMHNVFGENKDQYTETEKSEE